MKEPPVTPINPPATPQLPKYVRAALYEIRICCGGRGNKYAFRGGGRGLESFWGQVVRKYL
jgi:hypothetical protein